MEGEKTLLRKSEVCTQASLSITDSCLDVFPWTCFLYSSEHKAELPQILSKSQRPFFFAFRNAVFLYQCFVDELPTLFINYLLIASARWSCVHSRCK